MKRLLLIMALGLAPAAGMAQPYMGNIDEQPGFVAPLSTIGSGDHGVSTTDTSPAKARSVRRAGKTVVVKKGDEATADKAAPMRMARAGN